MGNQTINISTKYLFASGILFICVIIAIVAVIMTNKADVEQELRDCEEKIKESFDNFVTNIQRHPLIYPKNKKTVPSNCVPYSGCFFPSKASNPINLNTGERPNQPGGDQVWCKKSWRDCNAYQTCKNGRCVSKI